jgi:ATP-dependent helicase/nuclease subunit A
MRTFHSWFAQWIGAAPVEWLASRGIAAQATLLEEAAAHQREALRETIAALSAFPALLDDFNALVADLGRSRAVELLLAALTEHAAAADPAQHAITPVPSFAEIGPLWARLDATEEPPWAVLAWDSVHGLLSDAVEALDADVQKKSHAFKAKAIESAGDAWAALATGQPRAAMEAMVGAWLTQKGEARKNIGSAAEVQAAQAWCAEAAAALRLWDARMHHERMARLVPLVCRQYQALLLRERRIDMALLEAAAVALLTDAQLHGSIAAQLDARVRHVLVDEFQDTNPVQWRALSQWVSAYAGAGAGKAMSVFIVGDPKQSIYGFRGAQAAVFDAAKSLIVDGLDGALLTADATRRCAPELVEGINAVFGVVSREHGFAGFRAHSSLAESSACAGLFALPLIERPTKAEKTKPDATQWRSSFEREAALEEPSAQERQAEQAGDWLASEWANGTRDVMVIARKNGALQTLAAALRARGVPFQFADKDRLADVPAIQDLLAVVRCVAQPQNSLSLARALRSPLFGWSSERLKALGFVARSLAAQSGGGWFAALETAGFEAEAQQWRAIEKAWALLPPFEALATTLRTLDARAKLLAGALDEQAASTSTQIDALLEIAQAAQGAGALTARGFLRHLEQSQPRVPPSAARSAVRLLTIHGAKGLQADVVMLYDAWPEKKKAQGPHLSLRWRDDGARIERLVHLRSDSDLPQSWARMLDADAPRAQREEWNALYVALTRAKTRLIVSAAQPLIADPLSAWEAVLPHAKVIENTAPYQTPIGWSATAIRSVIEMPQQGLTGAVFEEKQHLAGVQQHFDAIKNIVIDEAWIGTQMHAMLEAWPMDGSEWEWSMELERTWLKRTLAGEPRLDREAACGALRIAFERAQRIQRHAAWAWDTAQTSWAQAEVEMTDAQGSLRIDRLVCRLTPQGLRWVVIDFKSSAVGARSEQALAQMLRYRAAVAQALRIAHDDVEGLWLTPESGNQSLNAPA